MESSNSRTLTILKKTQEINNFTLAKSKERHTHTHIHTPHTHTYYHCITTKISKINDQIINISQHQQTQFPNKKTQVNIMDWANSILLSAAYKKHTSASKIDITLE